MSVDRMLISKLSVSFETLEMLCAKVAKAGILACPVFSSDVLSSPSWPVQTSTASSSCNVSFASQTRSCTS